MATPSRKTPAPQAPAPTDLEQRAQRTAQRIDAIGVPKQELAIGAGVDRGTLARALKADPRISDRTWVNIERELGRLEQAFGITSAAEAVESSETVTGSVEYAGARITLSGKADAVADAIRKVLSEG